MKLAFRLLTALVVLIFVFGIIPAKTSAEPEAIVSHMAQADGSSSTT
jgi:hypothetical protein